MFPVDTTVFTLYVLNGTSAVLFVVLVALGLAIIFGMMRVINMAHGELFMLGAYTVYVTTTTGLNFWIGFILAPLVVALLGIAIERTIVRPLYGRRDLSTLLATWGVSIVLQQTVRLTFGAQPRSVASPFAGSVQLLGVTYPTYHIVAMGLSLLVIASIVFLFLRTDFGLMARATIQNAEVTAALGINTGRMFMLSFGLGSALAGLGGALMAPLIGVLPTMGLPFVIRSFLVVIVGGMGQLFGTFGGGIVIGGGESALTAAFNGTLAQIGVLLIVILLMLVRPRGLFER